MCELVHIQGGNYGNHTRARLREAIADEHGIDPKNTCHGASDLPLEYKNVCLSEPSRGRYARRMLPGRRQVCRSSLSSLSLVLLLLVLVTLSLQPALVGHQPHPSPDGWAAGACRGKRFISLPKSTRFPTSIIVQAFPDIGTRRSGDAAEHASWDRRSLLHLGLSAVGPELLWGLKADASLAISRTAEEKEAAKVFRDTTPGVVSVAREFRPGERRLRGIGAEDGLPPSLGSGFVWDDSHIVTNYHVVKEIAAGEIDIIFLLPGGTDDIPRREVVKGELVGSDPATDTAVVRVRNMTTDGKPRARVNTLLRGESSTLEVGQTVFAIGNPFGLEHSMSRGIISGISRTIDIGERPIRGCIQTDASINPGNSGGPLLDTSGRVIGVNTAILTGSGTSAGVGLAIPIDTVRKNVDFILKQGFVSRGFLGITFAPDVVSESLQIQGVIVFTLIPGSPAERAGLRPMLNGTIGDVITDLDGSQIRTGPDIFRFLDKKAPGDAISLGVRRARREEDGNATMEKLLMNITLGTTTPPGQPKRPVAAMPR